MLFGAPGTRPGFLFLNAERRSLLFLGRHAGMFKGAAKAAAGNSECTAAEAMQAVMCSNQARAVELDEWGRGSPRRGHR